MKSLFGVLRLAAAASAIVLAGFAFALASAGAAASQAAPKDVADMQGLYEEGGGVVAITPFGEFGDGFFFIDFASGRVGPLLGKADGFAIGNGMKDAKNEAGILAPTAKGLDATYDGERRALRRVPIDREPFVVANGGVNLAGEFVRRADAKPKGVVVIVHGSNDSPRNVYGPWVYYLAGRGWTVAVYDKRGSGESTGDWRKGDFTELASDARSVATFARSKLHLGGKSVGMLGISQAGWIMPLAALKGGFDFIVSLAGAAVTPSQQTLELAEGQLKAYDFPPAEIEKALAYYRLDLDVTTGHKPWRDVEVAYRQATAAKAEWLLSPPEPADSPLRAFLGRVAGFDPAPVWAKLHIPVLAIFGGKDWVVPVNPNRALLDKALGANGHHATRTIVIADANHVGMIARTGTFAEYPTLDHYDPAYFSSFGDWLDQFARP